MNAMAEAEEGIEELSITAPLGFRAAVTRSGLKKAGDDLALIYSERPATAAAVFTRNLVQAAPVVLSREHMRRPRHRAILVNSGCANACTGDDGLADAQRSAMLTAALLGCDVREVLVASTGVIGVRLDMEKLSAGIERAAALMSREAGARVAEAIMTTDTRPKRAIARLRVGGRTVTIAGVAKGAGMIHPDMATLLGFITTDAAIGKRALQTALRRAVNTTFNRISVDGDTSTNDTVFALANGAAGNRIILDSSSKDFERFAGGLEDVAKSLAVEVARDGEGAGKLITIRVRRAPSLRDAHKIAATVATSPLVKTAIAGSDANWGRILAAAGRSKAHFDPGMVEIRIGNLVVARRGCGVKFDESEARRILDRSEVDILIDLHQGTAKATEWTCDLTEGYIRINADYRS